MITTVAETTNRKVVNGTVGCCDWSPLVEGAIVGVEGSNVGIASVGLEITDDVGLGADVEIIPSDMSTICVLLQSLIAPLK